MMKRYTFAAKNGLWYEQSREYQLTCLTVPNSKMIGRWGQHHRRYLRQHKYGTYTELLLMTAAHLWLKEQQLQERSRIILITAANQHPKERIPMKPYWRKWAAPTIRRAIILFLISRCQMNRNTGLASSGVGAA